jgi:Baseplate J-like protein
MSGTSLLPSQTAAYVDETGIHAPTYADVVAYLTAQYQQIYGADAILPPDSQDGQLVGIFALAIADTNATAIAVYNSFSPSTAQGIGLSQAVKINGMRRATPTPSTVDLVIIGQAGRVILNGAAEDSSSNRWLLPAAVSIPPTGEITVHATCEAPGYVVAQAHTITRIGTPTLGWQSVDNPLAAVPGNPVETDAALRQRQTQSTALPSRSVLEGIIGGVLELQDVTHVKGYENDTGGTDPVTGLPEHSIALVVRGGDQIQICTAIMNKKTPGCFTYGTTRELVPDAYGLQHDIGFFIPDPVVIGVHITLRQLPGYSTSVGQVIQKTIADYINNLGSGVMVTFSKLWLPANLCDETTGLPTGATNTYDITDMTIATPATGTYATANIPITIYQIAQCDVVNVVITVT